MYLFRPEASPMCPRDALPMRALPVTRAVIGVHSLQVVQRAVQQSSRDQHQARRRGVEEAAAVAVTSGPPCAERRMMQQIIGIGMPGPVFIRSVRSLDGAIESEMLVAVPRTALSKQNMRAEPHAKHTHQSSNLGSNRPQNGHRQSSLSQNSRPQNNHRIQPRTLKQGLLQR